MPDIRLPDGAIKRFDAPVSVAQVAASIGPGLAKAALAGKVDGKLVDASHVIDRDASVKLIPEAQVTIGPVIEDGFYYDFSYKRPFTPEDLDAIQTRMASCRLVTSRSY